MGNTLIFLVIIFFCQSSLQARAESAPCKGMQGGSYTIALPGHPFGVAATKGGCHVFVALSSEGSPPAPDALAILKYNSGRLQLERIVPGGGIGLVLSRDEQMLIVAARTRVLFYDVARLIDGSPSVLYGSISTNWPQDSINPLSFNVNISIDDRILFVSDENAGRIEVIDLQRLRKVGVSKAVIFGAISVDPRPIAVTLSKDGRFLFTTSQHAGADLSWPSRCVFEDSSMGAAPALYPEGVLSVIDIGLAVTDPAHAVLVRVPSGCNPVRLVLAPDGQTAWVSARGSHALIGFDTALLVSDPTRARIGSVPVGVSPVGLGVTKDGNHVWVVDSGRFSTNPDAAQLITVVDISAGKSRPFTTEGVVKAGVFPRELLVLEDGLTLLVTNFQSRTLQVIDIATVEKVGTAKARPTLQ